MLLQQTLPKELSRVGESLQIRHVAAARRGRRFLLIRTCSIRTPGSSLRERSNMRAERRSSGHLRLSGQAIPISAIADGGSVNRDSPREGF